MFVRSLRRSLAVVIVLVVSSASASSARRAANPVAFSRGGASSAVEVKKAPLDIPTKHAIAAGLLFAFNSGYSNGCCLGGSIVEGTKQAVAAVTGAWTTSALGYATGNMEQFKTQMGMILSYAGGSAIAGALNPTPTPYKLSPSTGPALLIAAALMYTSSSLAVSGTASSLTIFSLATFANGLSNSVTSVHTGNLVRSAHYSGMTSDMGTFFGQVLRGNKANLFRLKVCAALALAFFAGGVVSVQAVKEFGTSSLLVSAFIYAAMGLGVIALQM